MTLRAAPDPPSVASSFFAALPRPLRARLRQTRRDIGVLRDGLFGRHPAPFFTPTPRPPSVAPSPSPRIDSPRALTVERLTRETEDAVTLHLVDRSGENTFLPGQFLTVCVSLEGTTHRRAYSISSSPLDAPRCAITVKRVQDGLVSNFIHDNVKEGDVLRVLGPSGKFVVKPSPETKRLLVFIAGGCGITPLMSMTRTVLALEPGSRILLLYGNRRWEDVIFRAALDELRTSNAGRLRVEHVLREPPVGWTGRQGVVDRSMVTTVLDAAAAEGLETAEYWICGPEPMMAEARAALQRRGAPLDRVHEERFATPQWGATDKRVEMAQQATARVSGGAWTFEVSPSQTILEAGLAGGAPLRFSCAMGGCGSCKVRLREGRVHMKEPNCLSPSERADGYVLACVSHPLEPVVIESEG